MKPAHAITRAGVAILICLATIRAVSNQFTVESPPETWAVWTFVLVLAFAGAVWFSLFRQISRENGPRLGILTLFVSGLLMRLVFFGSTPIYEDDWQRYLWDGASLSQGINPYSHAPASAAPFTLFGETIPASNDPELRELQKLAQSHPENHRRINFPFVSTIYPPLAQLAFAIAHKISPFDLDAWRGVLLAADCLSFGLLIAALSAYGRSHLWSLLFWWNPIAIYVTANAAHMDALLLPPLLATLFFVKTNRPWHASLALAVAVGIKLWPLLLAPLIFREYRKKLYTYIGIGLSVSLSSFLFVLPMLLSLDPEHSGLLAYSQSWERNAFIFPLLANLIELVINDGQSIARLLIAALVISLTLWYTLRKTTQATTATAPLLSVTAMLFFLSPTGYPWYALWLLAFLPFTPIRAIGLLTATLPLYYARYSLDAADLSWINEYILIPFQFGLPLVYLALERTPLRPPQLNSPRT